MPRKKQRSYGDYCEIRNGDIYARVNIPVGGGKYRIRRKKVENRTEARQWARDQLARVHHSATLETFYDLAEWYKEHYLVAPVIERGVKVEGVKDWQKSRAKLDKIVEFFGSRRLSAFNETDLLSYARMRRVTVTQTTINRDFALLRTMFRKGHQADGSIAVPNFPISIKSEVPRDRVMTLAEERRLLAACDKVEALDYERKGKAVTANHRTNREHLRAIVILAVDTAMRKGEIFGILWTDVDLEAGTINIRKEITKTGAARKVGLTPRVKQELEKIKGKGKVFPINSAYKSFNTACDRAKIKDLKFHDLRHTATTRMIRAGIPHMEVMKVTGHTQMKTFLRYLNLGDSTVKNTADLLAAYLEADSR